MLMGVILISFPSLGSQKLVGANTNILYLAYKVCPASVRPPADLPHPVYTEQLWLHHTLQAAMAGTSITPK